MPPFKSVLGSHFNMGKICRSRYILLCFNKLKPISTPSAFRIGNGSQHPGTGRSLRRKGFVAAQRGEDSGADALQRHLPGKRHQRKSPNRQKRQKGEVHLRRRIILKTSALCSRVTYSQLEKSWFYAILRLERNGGITDYECKETTNLLYRCRTEWCWQDYFCTSISPQDRIVQQLYQC